MVSSLPLLNKPDRERLALLDEAFQLMRADGCFIQFTYGMVSPIPRRAKGRIAPFFDAEPSPAVLLNLPPARVWVYRPTTSHAPVPKRRAGALMVKLRTNLKERRRWPCSAGLASRAAHATEPQVGARRSRLSMLESGRTGAPP